MVKNKLEKKIEDDVNWFLETRDNMYYQVVNNNNFGATQSSICEYQKAIGIVPTEVLYYMVADLMTMNKYVEFRKTRKW